MQAILYQFDRCGCIKRDWDEPVHAVNLVANSGNALYGVIVNEIMLK